MTARRRRGLAATAVAAAAAATVLGMGPAGAASVPTVSVTSSGDDDWQVTFDRGTTEASACAVLVDNRTAIRTEERTVTLDGDTVPDGPHAVRVLCEGQSSPTVWLHAPRGQINDIATWAGNVTAGIVGY